MNEQRVCDINRGLGHNPRREEELDEQPKKGKRKEQ
jgi:hypothetical protein